MTITEAIQWLELMRKAPQSTTVDFICPHCLNHFVPHDVVKISIHLTAQAKKVVREPDPK